MKWLDNEKVCILWNNADKTDAEIDGATDDNTDYKDDDDSVSYGNSVLIGLNSFMTEVPIIQIPVHWFAEQINGLISTW